MNLGMDILNILIQFTTVEITVNVGIKIQNWAAECYQLK